MNITANATNPEPENNKKGHFMVFHGINQEQMFHPNPELWQQEVLQMAGVTPNNTPRNFRAVALVFASSPEEVYQLTNHIETPWKDHKEVVSLTNNQERSTSVGDVILRVGVLDEKEEIELNSTFIEEEPLDTAYRVTMNRAVMVNHWGFIQMGN